MLVKQLRPAVLFAELLNDLKIDPNPGDDFADLNAKLKGLILSRVKSR